MELFALILTAIFTAMAALSAYISVTRGALLAARKLDDIDPVKQRLREIQLELPKPDADGFYREAILHLQTGQFVFVAKIHKIDYHAVRVHGCFAESPESDLAPAKIASDLTIRYSIIATVSI